MPRLLGPIGCAYTTYDLIERREEEKKGRREKIEEEEEEIEKEPKDRRNCGLKERLRRKERNDYLSKLTTNTK